MAGPHTNRSSLVSITNRLVSVRERIAAACERSNRSNNDVRLIAISKTRPVEYIREAIDAGQLDFGENQIQEALRKIPEVQTPGVQWHYIGPLQSNKTKHLPGNFHWWHTLNRPDIATRVSNKAVELGTRVETLIQVNVINDPAKSGVSIEGLSPLVEQLLESGLNGLNLRGLMTIGPHGGNEDALHQCFGSLRKLLETTRDQFGLNNFDQLSMGMTDDMEAAIAEGATMVRVGSAIFGSRE
jgi:pyridoxal phosphate enzyme (YggS family)